MAKKRNRAKHTATFEERLAGQAEKFKDGARAYPKVARRGNAYCSVPG